ncbi:hypothetical protein ACTWPB_17800 [Nocardia sp. IBHARD005]|uniref:hypothetical protein n=1 Tax=Nocardia sp. IBHARD005 TaxID=3457765 RepID=UPI004058A767
MHTTRAGTGERIHADIELEFSAQERRTDTCAGDLSRDIGTQFGDSAASDFARRATHCRGCRVTESAGTTTQYATDRATNGATESRQPQVGQPELVQGAITVGDLDHPGGEIDAAFFEGLPESAAQCESGCGFGRTTGEHAGDQLTHRDPDRDLPGDPRAGRGDQSDTGPRGREDLDRGHDHRADDHELGVRDIVGTVVE